MLYVFVKLSPCAGMQSISDRRRNCSIEPREKPQIMMTSILMKAMSFFLLEILCQISFWAWRWSQLSFCWNNGFFLLCCFRTACFKHKIKKLMLSLHQQKASGICGTINTHWTWSCFKAQKLSWMQFWKTKGILQTHSLRLLLPLRLFGKKLYEKVCMALNQFCQDCCYLTFLVPVEEYWWCSWSFSWKPHFTSLFS